MTTTEEISLRRKSSESSPPPPTSFSSLPYDVALNFLARVSRFHHPALSLVSKGFRSLIASPELDATRSSIGKTEDCIYLCLNLDDQKNPNPSCFTLSPVPTQHKPVRIPSLPYQHSKYSTVVAKGSEIYVIGGILKGKRSKRVLVLDCRSHQWRKLPNMRLRRAPSAAHVGVDGKIYVIGGSRFKSIDNWGEVYDPETQTWEPILPTALDDLIVQKKHLVPGSLVMGGKVYHMDDLFQLHLKPICLVEIDKALCPILVSEVGDLLWRDPNDADSVWSKSVVACRKGRKRRRTNEFKTKILCTQVSFERRDFGELRAFVEWSKTVFTFDGCDSPSYFVLHSAIVTL
ncbi:PREDICTED: putative F-box/kelch-repeat protein At5g03000 [Camelina sativa]|uniref:F-box/kelch-repeat protein At5g03000 n=1 Tax=Camelina sativa TaxID=90675 RepID=A0ABM0TDL3_CAMSA|nr:PREDICTED: putative F-box/kelch-repeat protein At5g03000 [Camelina sativa]